MIYNLQALRAVAAIIVVIFHIMGTSVSYSFGAEIFAFLRGWGEYGVDLFFVISGFVMVYVQMNNERGAGAFLKSRLIRIVPIYWFLTSVLLLMFVIAPALIRSSQPDIGWAVASYAFVSQPIYGKFPLLYVGWTLEWEMFFYTVFGLALLSKSWPTRFAFIIGCMIAVSILCGDLIAFDFIGGMLIGYLYMKRQLDKRLALGLLLAGIILLLPPVSTGLENTGVDRFFKWGIPSMMIITGAVYYHQTRSWLVKELGDASYSIYLIQVIVIPAFYKISSALPVRLNPDLLFILCLAANIVAGWVLYRVFEKPITNTLRRALSSERNKAHH